ncbi:hypothetical protein [Vannielia litorea]|uniref:Uncharacterized protein n=1 Tax=Vannielia litorea TaxID=1217970 RepID=A0A1N6IFC9_9RHOB|nr:hypothetical protein [Vannielia litorea]SIO30746.1 hypothetical protein SAMN05444002_3810 [Vannielia litorea]
MPRAKTKFTQSDVQRAIKATMNAGLTVFGVTITPQGFISVDTAQRPAQGPLAGPEDAFDTWNSQRSSREKH